MKQWMSECGLTPALRCCIPPGKLLYNQGDLVVAGSDSLHVAEVRCVLAVSQRFPTNGLEKNHSRPSRGAASCVQLCMSLQMIVVRLCSCTCHGHLKDILQKPHMQEG